MEKVKAFCKRKNIEISVKRYLIDALGAMAQGLFASLFAYSAKTEHSLRMSGALFR